MELSIEHTKTLAILSIITGFSGLLFFAPETAFSGIRDITPEKAGQIVSVTGIARNVSISRGNIFFELENNGRIKAVFFKPKTEQMLLIKEEAELRATGTIAIYNSELEIIIEKVKNLE